MPKVLMPLGDATEVLDTFYAYFRLPEDGFQVDVAGPEARLYHAVLHEVPPGSDPPWDITQERPGYHIPATIAFRDVDPTAYAGLFVSGGRAPEYLRYDQDLLRITRHFFEVHKPIAALCHGIDGGGGRGPALNKPKLARATTQAELVKLIQEGIPGTQMSASWMLSEQEVDGVAAYVLSLSQRGSAAAK